MRQPFPLQRKIKAKKAGVEQNRPRKCSIEQFDDLCDCRSLFVLRLAPRSMAVTDRDQDLSPTKSPTFHPMLARLYRRPSSGASSKSPYDRLTAATGAHAGWRVGSTNHVVYVPPRTMGCGCWRWMTAGRPGSTACVAGQVADRAYHFDSVSPATVSLPS